MKVWLNYKSIALAGAPNVKIIEYESRGSCVAFNALDARVQQLWLVNATHTGASTCDAAHVCSYFT